jgi:hypothetical protein
MNQRLARDTFLEAGQDLVNPVYDYIDAQNMEYGFILGVLNQRHGAGDLEDILGDLADNQVGFIAASHGDQHIGPGNPGFAECSLVGAVSMHRNDA